MAASGPGEGAGSQTLAVGQPLSSRPRGAGRRWGLGARLGLRPFPGPRPGRAGGGAAPSSGLALPPPLPNSARAPRDAGEPTEAGKGTGREGAALQGGGKPGARREPGAPAKEERRLRTAWESQEKVVKSQSLGSTTKKKKTRKNKKKLTDERRGPGNCRENSKHTEADRRRLQKLGALHYKNAGERALLFILQVDREGSLKSVACVQTLKTSSWPSPWIP